MEQGQGGFLPHPRNPGDVVRGISHQGLQVHHLGRGKAVGRPKRAGVHLLGGGLSHAGGNQFHVGMVRDQLQGVLVPRGHPAVPTSGLAPAGDGADQVIRLPAGQLIAGDVHGIQHLFQHRHLHRQLLGHSLPLGLVVCVGQVPEGGLLPVKGHTHPVRVHFFLHPPQDIQKSKNGMGGKPLPVVQGVHSKKGPVHNGIPVNHQQFHPVTSFAAGYCPAESAASHNRVLYQPFPKKSTPLPGERKTVSPSRAHGFPCNGFMIGPLSMRPDSAWRPGGRGWTAPVPPHCTPHRWGRTRPH